jgi:dienelactone hydrolase
MSTYNFDRRLWSLTFIWLMSSFFPCDAWGEGYGNGTKTFTAPAEMDEADWSDSAEMQRTWDAALVRIPGTETQIRKFSMHERTETTTPEQATYPTVIYLHGCSGVWQGTYRRIDFLAEHGFAVIAPLSFARKKYPQSCDTRTHRGGLYRPTLRMRQFDAGFAIQNAKKIDWVNANNVFLMGLSQGGITTATFHSENPASAVNARVVEGWTCHAGWEEYQGINAPAGEAVLTLVGKRDPWFQRPSSRGDCGAYLNTKNGSRSVVFRTDPLGSRHELLEFKEVQQTVLNFLQDNIRN